MIYTQRKISVALRILLEKLGTVFSFWSYPLLVFPLSLQIKAFALIWWKCKGILLHATNITSRSREQSVHIAYQIRRQTTLGKIQGPYLFLIFGLCVVCSTFSRSSLNFTNETVEEMWNCTTNIMILCISQGILHVKEATSCTKLNSI